MPNTLFAASSAPAVMPSGSQTTITVLCQVVTPGPMTIGASNGYSIISTQRQLAAGQAQDVFSETISGPPGDCFLTFVFQGSGTETVVTIT
jgi:hypothetical protein